jgi:hypothetical protein
LCQRGATCAHVGGVSRGRHESIIGLYNVVCTIRYYLLLLVFLIISFVLSTSLTQFQHVDIIIMTNPFCTASRILRRKPWVSFARPRILLPPPHTTEGNTGQVRGALPRFGGTQIGPLLPSIYYYCYRSLLISFILFIIRTRKVDK